MPAGLKYLCLCGWEVTVEKRRWWRRGWCCRWYNKILDRNHRGKSNQIEREMANWADNEEVKGVRVRGAGNHIMMGRTRWPIVPWCGRRWCYSSCPGLRASSSAVCVYLCCGWLAGSLHICCVTIGSHSGEQSVQSVAVEISRCLCVSVSVCEELMRWWRPRRTLSIRFSVSQ